MNTFKKFLRITGLSLLLCLFLALAAFAAAEEPAAETVVEFTDVAGHVYETEINAMHEGGYAIGFTDGSFRPGRSFTRVELAQLMADILSLDTEADASATFTDTDVSGADAIQAAVAAGLMEGRSAQSFEPYDSVLKAELYDTLVKAYELLDITDMSLVMDEELLSWSNDYTVLNAGEAMYGSYNLVLTIALQEEIANAAASEEPDSASNEPAEEESGASEEPVSESLEEPAQEDAAVEDTEEGVEVNAEETTETVVEEEATADSASAEPEAEAASAEPEENATASSTEPDESTTASIPAHDDSSDTGNTETETTQPVQTTEPATANTASEPAQSASEPEPEPAASETSVPETKADEIRQVVYDKYYEIRDSLVELLQSAVDALGLS